MYGKIQNGYSHKKGRRSLSSLLSPYNKYLLERWNEGCHNGTKLWQEIQEQGYQGSYATVTAYTHRLRDAQQLQKGEFKTNQSELKVFEPKKSLLTVRRAVKLILRKPSQRTDSDNQAISLLKQHPNLNTAIELVQNFADLVRDRQPEKLKEWY